MKEKLKSYGIIALGSVLFGLAFDWFFDPNQVAMGGITGLAQVINALLPGIPVGVLTIVLNVPLFIAGWRYIGFHLLASSLFSMAVSSVAIDLIAVAYPFEPMDPMLASVFGGALIGLSLGMVFLQGATTGGTDLIARLLKLKLAWLPMGRLLLAVDLLVIVAVAVAFRNIYSALYGVVALYISSFVMDQVLYGMDNAKVAYIISDAYDQISHAIIHDMDRGVTLLHGEGGWSGEDKKVLLVAFKQKQIVALKQTVKSIDPNAFLIVCEAHEILGDGFREYKHNDL